MSAPAELAWRLGAGLREEPVDPQSFQRAVDKLVDEISRTRSQPARLLAMLQHATPLLRIAGRLEEARKTASAAIALAELEGRYEISTPLFDQLIAQARSSPALAGTLHDVLFNAGRNLFDQEHFAEAGRCFRESQGLRRSLGLDHLLEMSAEAIRQAKKAAVDRDRKG
jgi:tetratricopeptide (TPR) repeat protein